METLAITMVKNFDSKNALEQLYLERYVKSLHEWKDAVDQYGRTSKQANEKRIKAERNEWFLWTQCIFLEVCTTSLKRQLNLFPY